MVLRKTCRKHDNFRKNYLNGLRFGTFLEGPKSKKDFVNQPFSTNGSGFIHKKRFSKNEKFNFSAKIYEKGKNVEKRNYLFPKDLQIRCSLFFYRIYIVSFVYHKRFTKNQKLNFPAKIYEKEKKVMAQTCLFPKDLQIRPRQFFYRIYIFSFVYHKRYSKNQKFNFFRQNIRETEKMLRNKIVYFQKIYKFAFHNFSIEFISFHLFIKTVFQKIKNSIFPPKYTRNGKMLRDKIVYFQKIYKFAFYNFSIEFISFHLFIINVIQEIKKSTFSAKIYEKPKKC